MPKFRLDRALSVGLVQPYRNITRPHAEPTVPILMYHSIRSDLATGQHPYFETNTHPELFARHLQFLHENGYATVDLSEALAAIMTGQNRQKRVAITFDDGYGDFYKHAFPLLMKYCMKATVFVVSDWTREQRVSRDGREYLTWQEIREMYRYGIRVGSHTVSHPELYSLNPSKLEYEIRQSKENIEGGLGEPIRSFSYPYAFPEQDAKFVVRLRELLETHGYENGVSTILGTASRQSDWFFLPRLPVNSFDDLQFFRAKLEGGYNWLHSAQYLTKTMKSLYRGR